jgi:transmembrane sensor
MHQENKRYYELAEKWLNGTITKEEMTEFSEWYDSNESPILDIPEKFASSEEELGQRILGKILTRQKKRDPFTLKKANRLKWAAASVLILVAFASLFYLTRKFPATNETVVTGQATFSDTVVPGGNKAMLVLGDGTKVLLDTADNGVIADTRFTKLDDGQLACSPIGEKNPINYNTLTTPRGGQYSITLADGTRVWLNSASSLRFPDAFSMDKRIVELTGEGYFEVDKNKTKPFKVKVGDVEVQVLGTHFNIMAYKDEASINTTLLEGSVRISRQNDVVELKPGQEAQTDQYGKIGINKNANIEQAIAWKNGIFNFSGSNIESTMRQIARWYDIEVVYEDEIGEHFNGSIVRNSSIEKVLKMLEHTGVVHFTLKGRKVFVRSGN